ncbi:MULTISPECIES: AAA family ATPase [Chryseobacterium]|uniref:AAA family ATPase n=1 Tax=Chryseobacterium TaxID=59732 RepID=UPI00135CB420|nr:MULTISPECIES: AAA family ATPase [Chryseobacterium]MBM7419566.1 putative ATPase [Chryseobacterium sp. JUb44]MDH6209497.1 putative ATPase [Chryseobacterium sp. BIGb0186]WSO12326.1 AAA family ATPase [Chryseobacterium scophthalmum]
MKPAKLIVKNFGPLKDVDILVTDFLCLIGRQATGKSTIAKLIAIFEDENFKSDVFEKDLFKYGLNDFINEETFISYKVDEDNTRSILYFDFVYEGKNIKLNNFRSYFNHLFEENRNKDSRHDKIDIIDEISKHLVEGLINFDDPNTGQKLTEIFKDITLQVKNYNVLFQNIKLRLDKNREGNTNDLDAISEFSTISKDFEKLINDYYNRIIDFLKLDSQYIPSERSFLHIIAENTLGLINNDIKIPKHLLEIGQEYEKALNTVKEIPLTIVNKNYKYKREGKSSNIYHGSNDKVNLLQSASGLQSVLPIMLLIEYAKTLKYNYHFNYVVEEPELNIYPETQHNLIKYLVSNIFDFYANNFQRKKLVITTHSPYILASINNLLLAFKKGKEKPKETHKIIKRGSWINPQSFNAYELKNGKSYKIMNDKIGQIKSNIIDTVTDEFSDEFDKLLSL